MHIMKISNPLWTIWWITVWSRSGWCEMCRLSLACRLHVSLQVLYWGEEVMLIWGWYNGPEVTGDLMRGTWHWNVFCAGSFLPMQMTAKWRSVSEGREQAAFSGKIKIIVKDTICEKNTSSFFSANLKIHKLLHFLYSLCFHHCNSSTLAVWSLKRCYGGVSWMIDERFIGIHTLRIYYIIFMFSHRGKLQRL